MQILQKIPAGAKVTITEIYSGASYEVKPGTDSVQTIEVVKAQEPQEPGSVQKPETQKVSFDNTYADTPKGGSSIVNHFEYTKPDQGETGGAGTGGAGTGTDSNAPGGTQNAGGTWSFEQQTDSTGSGGN